MKIAFHLHDEDFDNEELEKLIKNALKAYAERTTLEEFITFRDQILIGDYHTREGG